MKFTFGVLAYNQEKMIIETLESIKYQIVHYGRDYEFRLIIVDDCSKDKTTDMIELWLKSNHNYFMTVDCRFNEENQGVVKNYQYIMRKIEDENFKVIAGDDLFSTTNLFGVYENLTNDRIVTCLELDFNDQGVYYQEEKLMNYFYHLRKKKNKKYNLKNMRRGSYFNTPSTIFKKKLYLEAAAEKLNSQFSMFEDDPTWYSMIKYGAEVMFIKQNIVLYRMHDQSISNSGTKNERFMKELNNLVQKYYMESKGIEKVYLWFRMHPNIPKYLNFSIYVNKLLFMYRKKKVKGDCKYIELKKRVGELIVQEDKHYKNILQEAQKYQL